MAIASEHEERTTDKAQGSGAAIVTRRSAYRHVKRILDILLALVALALLLLPMLLIALLILLIDGKPVLYRQTRLGRGGRKIVIFKFRSMCSGADEQLDSLDEELLMQYRREYKIDRDPRVTRLGAILRRTSMDELPQLWNVLRGELSIVGPRPILPEELSCYSPADRDLFLSVTPGLTGYWQACAAPDDTYTSGKRQRMELHYAANLSFGFDLKILLKTFHTVIRKSLKK